MCSKEFGLVQREGLAFGIQSQFMGRQFLLIGMSLLTLEPQVILDSLTM